MKSMPLTARKRETSGKGVARKLRARGAIPAIFYGEKTEPVGLEVNKREFSGILKKSSSEHILIDLTIEGGDGGAELALVKEVQHDPVSEDILHADFLHIHATKRIRVTVPVHLNGLPEGVKNFGGILQQVMRSVEVEALPTDIPDTFEVDVSSMNIRDAVHVSDLIADNVTMISAAERTVATLVPPIVIAEVGETDAAEEETIETGDTEVISDKKKEDGEDESKESK